MSEMTPQHPATEDYVRATAEALGLNPDAAVAHLDQTLAALRKADPMTPQPPAAPETDAVVEVGAYAQQKEATARAVNDAARMAQIAARRTRELAAMTARAKSAEAERDEVKAELAVTAEVRDVAQASARLMQARAESAEAAHTTEPAPASPPAVAASTGTNEDVEALATLLRRHNDVPDGNNRYTSDLQDALFNVWAEADDNVGDYEIGERLAEAAIKSITDTVSDWLAAREAAARADERERWERAAQRLGELWITPRLLQTLRAYIAREGR